MAKIVHNRLIEMIRKTRDLKAGEQFLLGNQNGAFAILCDKTECYNGIRKMLVM